MKVVTILGARPQFIKASAVTRVLRADPGVQEMLIHTGQHYDNKMSRVFFEELEIPEPDYNIGIGSGMHGVQTGQMLEAIEPVLTKECPDWVLVYGDTNSTLAGALAAVKLHIPIAHVEAGLRSFKRRMPEEINRVLTDHASDILFAPTQSAVANLQSEGILDDKIYLVGDVMYDVSLYYGAIAEQKSKVLEQLELRPKEYILSTIHRAENTNDPIRLRAIFKGLVSVAREKPVVLPLHPRTRIALTQQGLLEEIVNHIQLIEPVGYLDMVMMEKNACLIATDSGGVQKEASFYKVPCVTLRDETEWVELVASGCNKLLPPLDSDEVAKGILDTIGIPQCFEENLYGDGYCAEKIVQCILRRT